VIFLKIRLAASAFVPGLLIVAVRVWNINNTLVWSGLLVLAAGAATLSLSLLLGARATTNAQPLKITELEDESAQVPAYLLTYVFPFVFLDLEDRRDAVAYFLFALLLIILILRTDLWKVNPLLLLSGYHTYVVQRGNGTKSVMFARARPERGETVQVVNLTGGALKRVG
jgi:hypothetical protein